MQDNLQSEMSNQAAHGDDVPRSLRVWFIIHFIVDALFAIPLFVAPSLVLAFFGFTGETFMARLIAAALVGIGGASIIVANKNKDHFDALLNVKLLWSGTAISAIVISLWQGSNRKVWLLLITFSLFFTLWTYYKRRLST